MFLHRTRTLGVVAGLFSGALMLTGCGQAMTSSAPAPDSGQGGGANTGTSGGVSGSDISASPCSAEDFGVTMTAQPGRQGVFLLALENQSDKTCPVSGWVDLVGTNMAGEPMTEVTAEKVEVPGPPTEIVLEPGESAFSGVHITVSQGAPNVASGFIASPPNMDESVQVEISGDTQYVELPIESIQVGSLQPSPQGVTFSAETPENPDDVNGNGQLDSAETPDNPDDVNGNGQLDSSETPDNPDQGI